MRPRPAWADELESRGLQSAGLRTTSRPNEKTPALLQAAIQQSPALKAFVARGKPLVRSKNYFHYASDAEFDHFYLKLNKMVVPFGSAAEKALLNVRGFYDRATDSIHLRPATDIGIALQLAVSRLSAPAFQSFFGKQFEHGVSLYLANLILKEQGLEPMKLTNDKHLLDCATDLVAVAGLPRVARAYFQNHASLIDFLTSKLSIGAVSTTELAGDALCKTPLLRTARFANHQSQNMVAVGITGPRWVRLWMRSAVAGPHELQIIGSALGSQTIRITVPAGKSGDKTAAVTYPQTSAHPQLKPLTRYRYRVVRTSDGTPLGEGSFETSPAGDKDTPNKVVAALISCHQPFAKDGSIDPDSARMLRILPRILQENNVKFVLPCGDQIYADDPGVFSLFSNPYLIRQTVPGKSDIFKCTADEVRRVYDTRYRTLLSMNSIRKMYSNYPCYPTLDDHEIRGDWGSDPKHASPQYQTIRRGALDAYFDYQASGIFPPTTRVPDSFHYDFSYGNIGVFVMDIRSQRAANSPTPIYSDLQLNDFRQFLQNNADKKVLFIVASVPVIHLARLLTDAGVGIINPILGLFDKDIDFPDHWSYEKNIPARNALLSMLHAHQQAHPNQRVAILSGDVHIGNAFSVLWGGRNKPRLYQFTSSPVTALFRGIEADITTLGPRLLSGIDCPATKFGGACSGKVSLLEGVRRDRNQNPMVGLNVGLIEVQKFGDVSNLKFKLLGYHPKEDRPVVYFESAWLG